MGIGVSPDLLSGATRIRFDSRSIVITHLKANQKLRFAFLGPSGHALRVLGGFNYRHSLGLRMWTAEVV